MTNTSYRHLVLIVDRSGSMEGVADDMNGGIRKFVEEQATVPGHATLSLYQFDTIHDEVRDFAPLTGEVLKGWRLRPRGGTALLDATGTAIQRTGEKLEALPEDQRPGVVVVMIVTDGHENSSREYKLDQVKSMITRQREQYGWTFMFLGADQDAFASASSIGIPHANAASYSSHNSGDMFATASASMTRGAAGQSAGYSFTPEEREKLVEDQK